MNEMYLSVIVCGIRNDRLYLLMNHKNWQLVFFSLFVLPSVVIGLDSSTRLTSALFG